MTTQAAASPPDLQSSPIIKRIAILLGKYEAFSDNLEIVARTVAPIYHMVREDLLQQHYWAFAMGMERLNKRADKPAFGYEMYFDLPTDYLATTLVNNTGEKDLTLIGATGVFGNKFASDYEPVYMMYTKNIVNEALFAPLFRTALVYSLATEVCLPVTHDKDLLEHLTAKMREFTFEGMNVDMREHKYTQEIKSNQYIADRIGVDGTVLGGLGQGFNSPVADVQQSTTGIEQPERVANELVNQPQTAGG